MMDTAQYRRPPRVLVLDDEEDFRETLAGILELEEFTVQQCDTATSAITTLAQGGIDVAVVDLRIPDLDETTLLAKLGQFSDAVPIIVYTGHSSYETAKEAINWGAFAYVEKAGDPTELIRQVHRAAHVHLTKKTRQLEEAVAERTGELKASNDSLLRVRADLDRAQRIAKIGSFSWDVRSGEVNWSDQTYRIFGLDPAETTPSYELVRSLWHPDDVQRWADEVAQAMESSDWLGGEYRAIRSDGAPLWIRHEVEIVRDSNGNVTQLFGAVHDTTERKRAEIQLRESETRFRKVFDQQYQFMAILDPEGRTIEINDLALKTQGLQRDDYVGKYFWDAPVWKKMPGWRLTIRERVVRAQQTVGPVVVEDVYQTSAGKSRYADAAYTAIRDETDTIQYILVQAQDITERKALEERLRHTQKMEAIGQLAAGVAHEFNNLLCGILCNVDTLLDDKQKKLTKDIELALQDVQRCGQRGAKLTKQLLAFSRRQSPEVTQICLNDVITGLDRMVQQLVSDQVLLELQLAPDLPDVIADQGIIEQAIVNLARNAKDAMPDGGRLTIRTASEHIDEHRAAVFTALRPGPHVRLSISDTGCGMTPDVQSRAFEPFFTTKPAGQGTGLGLSTVFADLTHLRGGVEVESKLNEGTTFHLYLPCLDKTSC